MFFCNTGLPWMDQEMQHHHQSCESMPYLLVVQGSGPCDVLLSVDQINHTVGCIHLKLQAKFKKKKNITLPLTKPLKNYSPRPFPPQAFFCHWAERSCRRVDAVWVRQEADEMRSDSSALPLLDSKCQQPDSICTKWQEQESVWAVCNGFESIHMPVICLWFWQLCTFLTV